MKREFAACSIGAAGRRKSAVCLGRDERVSATRLRWHGSRTSTQLALVGALVGLLLAGLPVAAEAGLYTFTEIARTRFQSEHLVKSGSVPFTNFSFTPSINQSGTVSFKGEDWHAAGGIYTGVGGLLNTIADGNGPLSPFPDTGPFSWFRGSTSINDSGDVAFMGWSTVTSPKGPAVARSDGGSGALVKITDHLGPFSDLYGGLSMNNAGTVAFRGILHEGGYAIGVGNGGPMQLVATAPSVGFSGLGFPVINSATAPEVAFTAVEPGGVEGVFRGGVSDPKVPIATTIGSLSDISFSDISINDSGEVLFTAKKALGREALFTADGSSITTVADSNGPFESFGSGGLALSNTGLAFFARLDAGYSEGVFTGPNVLADKVLLVGDSIAGFPSTVKQIDIGPQSLNDSGFLAMHVRFADGRKRILRADPLGRVAVVAVERGLNAAGAMKSDDSAVLVQVVDGMPNPTELSFDYLFTTTTGQLLVQLDGVTLATLDAPPSVASAFTSSTIQVDIPDLFPNPPTTFALEFVLEAEGPPAGLLLDDIDFPGLANGDFGTGDLSFWDSDASIGGAVGVAVAPPPIPEPSTFVLLSIGTLSVLTFAWRRGRRRIKCRRDVVASPAPMRTHAPLIAAALGLLLMSAASPARAGLYQFTEIATNRSHGGWVNPNAWQFSTFSSVSINETGNVAFGARLDDGEQGIFTGRGYGYATRTIVDTRGSVETLGKPSINDYGDVSFIQTTNSDITSVVSVAPFSGATTTYFFENVLFPVIHEEAGSPISNLRDIVFLATYHDGLDVIVEARFPQAGILSFNWVAKKGSGKFSDLGAPVVSSSGPGYGGVAFWATELLGPTGIYKGPTYALGGWPTIANDSGQFSRFGKTPSINTSGEVFFLAEMDNGVKGVFIGNGSSVTTVADSTGPFDRFASGGRAFGTGGLALSDTVRAFEASLDFGAGHGVFTGPDVVNHKVLMTEDFILGTASTVTAVRIGPESLNDRGQLAMRVVFADGRESIFLTDPLGSVRAVQVGPGDVNPLGALKSDQTAILVQVVDGMPDPTELTFDYLFTTTTGRLLVNLEGVTLATIDAPPVEGRELSTATIQVDIPDLFPDPPSTFALEFILEAYDNPSGLLLDNINFPGLANGDFGTGDLSLWESDVSPGGAVGVAIAPAPVPEPSTFVLLSIGALSLVGYAVRRRRRRARCLRGEVGSPGTRPTRGAIIVTALGLWLTGLPAATEAGLYSFTEIAVDRPAGPWYKVGTLPFDSFKNHFSINQSGEVAFLADLKDGSSGVFTGDGAMPNTIVDTDGGWFSEFWGPSINDSGDVSFVGRSSGSGSAAVMRYNAGGGTFTTITDSIGWFPAYPTFPNHSSIHPYADGTSINNGGTVAFLGQTFSQGDMAIAVGNGGQLSFVARSPSLLFYSLQSAPVIKRGLGGLQVAFTSIREKFGTLEAQIFRGGSANYVPLVTTGGQFIGLSDRPSINDSGDVLFTAWLVNGYSGVFIANGSSFTPVAHTIGPFTDFYVYEGQDALSNTGLAFKARLNASSISGIFTGPDAVNDKVLAKEDSLPGFLSTVTDVVIGPESLNDLGQLAMKVTFADGRQRILRADPLGTVTAVQVEPGGLNAAAAMKSSDMAVLGQGIDSPIDPTELVFDYLFTTTTGQLLVNLEGVTLASIPAPQSVASAFTTATIQVDMPDLFPDPPSMLALEFVLEAEGPPAGLLLDNIDFPGLANGDFGTGDLSLWESDVSPGGAVGVAVAPPPMPIPEPSSLVLCVLGTLGLLGFGWRPPYERLFRR